MSVLDETAIVTDPSPEEIETAKHLPYLQAVGLLSYPASQCKFEIRYAVSLVESRRSGWSHKHFDIVIKIFEYELRLSMYEPPGQENEKKKKKKNVQKKGK